MGIQVELNPEIEAELKARAERDGLSLSQYVQRVLEQQVPVLPSESTLTPEERARAFQDWAENFPYRRNTPLSDDAISREAIYQRENE